MSAIPEPRRLLPLPDAVTTLPLSRADAGAHGVSAGELRGPFWQRPTRGRYLWSGVDPATTDVRIAQAVTLLPEQAAIGGWASLFLQGAVDLDGGPDLRVDRVARLRPSRAGGVPPRTGRAPAPPYGGSRSALPAPVLASVGPGARIRPRADLDISRRTLPDEDVVMVGDVPCVRGPRALVDLMGHQPAEEGLVSVDAYLRFGVGELADVQEYVDRHPRVIGARRIRRLITLADGRTRSKPETRLRFVWVVEAGLPRPLVNVPLLDRGGRLLGIPDLLDEESGIVGEYDGGQHRALAAHTADNEREEGFERHNLLVVRATVLDLRSRRRQLVARLRAARRDGLARDRSRDRWVVER